MAAKKKNWQVLYSNSISAKHQV